ncbi:MAG: hypothetical protein J7M38_14885, partial [Armatimonadetes bacterium]|nr:hypothetical protein [Armatimonadota bacterium]
MIEIMLIPEPELATGEAAKIRNNAIRSVVAQVSRELRLPHDQLIVRDIDPSTDLDYTHSTWSELTGSTTGVYETMSTGTMDYRRYVGIYGIKDDSECINVTKIRIKVANSTKA